MGGNAFKKNKVAQRRIFKEEIAPTLEHLCSSLNLQDFDITLGDIIDGLTGSTGKKNSSGDIDIVLNNTAYLPFKKQTKSWNKDVLLRICERVEDYLGEKFYSEEGYNACQINILWPIVDSNEYIQIDFFWGDAEWIKFTHYSPEENASNFKGVYISTLYGVLSKLRKHYQLFDDSGNEVRRICYNYDLEKGLIRNWFMPKNVNQKISKVDPDFFETNTPDCPRFIRTSYINDPQAVVNVLFDNNVKVEDLDTFEKAWSLVKRFYTKEEMKTVKENMVFHLWKHEKKNFETKEEFVNNFDNLLSVL